MKTRLNMLCSFFLIMILMVTGGCSGKQTGEDSSSPQTGSKKEESEVKITVSPQMIGNENASIELVWQPNPPHSLSDSNPKKLEYLTAKATEWAQAHPDVKIKIMDTTTAITESMAKTLVQASSGQAPDMGAIDSFIFPQFYDYVQPIDDVMQEKGIQIDDFYDFAKGVMKPQDETLGLWYTTDVRVLFYRKDLISEAPKTWAEVEKIGNDLKAKGMDAFIYTAARDEATVMSSVLPYFWGQGGTLVNDQGLPVFGEGDNRQYLIDQLTFQKKCIDDGITPSRVVGFGTDPDYIPDVAAGQVGMFVAGNYMSGQLSSVIGEDEFSKMWGVAQIPMKDEGSRVTASGGWVSAVFTKDEEKRKLCADFLISMYVDDEGMAGWCKAGGYLPTRESVYDTDDYFNTDEVMQACREELKYAEVRPSVDSYTKISESLQIMLSDVLTGTSTPEKAVDNAFENAQKE